MHGSTASLPARVVPDSEPGSLRVGSRLGTFELVALIATGGMAQVWVARHAGALGFRRLVALKIIRPDLGLEPAMRSMFLEEARISARLRHANVVEVIDLGEVGADDLNCDWQTIGSQTHRE